MWNCWFMVVNIGWFSQGSILLFQWLGWVNVFYSIWLVVLSRMDSMVVFRMVQVVLVGCCSCVWMRFWCGLGSSMVSGWVKCSSSVSISRFSGRQIVMIFSGVWQNVEVWLCRLMQQFRLGVIDLRIRLGYDSYWGQSGCSGRMVVGWVKVQGMEVGDQCLVGVCLREGIGLVFMMWWLWGYGWCFRFGNVLVFCRIIVVCFWV